MDALAAVKGISRDRAVQLILVARGEDAGEWLRTPRAVELHADIVARLQARAATAWARNRLELLLPTKNAALRSARQSAIEDWHGRFASLDLGVLRDALGGLARLKAPKARPVADIVVLVEGEDDLALLEAAGMTRWVTVTLPDEPVQDAGMVVYASRRGAVEVGPDVVEIPFTTPDDIVPWPSIAFFSHNRRALESAAAVRAALGQPSTCAEALAVVDASDARAVSFDDVAVAAEAAAAAANAAVKEKARALTLSGDELLEALAGSTRRIDPLLREAQTIARRHLRDAVGMDLAVFVDRFPVEVDDEGLEAARRRFEAEEVFERYHAARKAASALGALRERAEQEVESAFELDYFLALERFRRDHACTVPAAGPFLDLRGALHLGLVGRGVPVDYDLDGGVALLTGANSGGKTTLLETIAQVAILAHMGLPVPAREATVPVLDGCFFFTRPRGLDAGAFETFLTSFEPVALDPSRCLVLADELEAMTELEAAGAILGVLVGRLVERRCSAVVVTHLADPILAHVDVRVDGIEARGLDASNDLVVDRTPRKNHRARSTPEFVLQRLRNTRTGPARALYDEMLERVGRARDNVPPQAPRQARGATPR